MLLWLIGESVSSHPSLPESMANSASLALLTFPQDALHFIHQLRGVNSDYFFFLQFSVLYIVSFVVITIGFILFNIIPTYTPAPCDATESAYQSVATAEVVQGDGETALDCQQDGQQEEKCGHTEPCTTLCALKCIV